MHPGAVPMDARQGLEQEGLVLLVPLVSRAKGRKPGFQGFGLGPRPQKDIGDEGIRAPVRQHFSSAVINGL